MEMIRIESEIKNSMGERGIIGEDYKIKVIQKTIISNSDWAKVFVEVYKPRSRKPDMSWDLAINFVRNIIDWDKSSFAYLK